MSASRARVFVAAFWTTHTVRAVVSAVVIVVMGASDSRAGLIVTTSGDVQVPENGSTGSAVFTFTDDGTGVSPIVKILGTVDQNAFKQGFTKVTAFYGSMTSQTPDQTDTVTVTGSSDTLNAGTRTEVTLTPTPANPTPSFTITVNYTVAALDPGEKDVDHGVFDLQIAVPWRFNGKDTINYAVGDVKIDVGDPGYKFTPEPSTIVMIVTAVPVGALVLRRRTRRASAFAR